MNLVELGFGWGRNVTPRAGWGLDGSLNALLTPNEPPIDCVLAACHI